MFQSIKKRANFEIYENNMDRNRAQSQRVAIPPIAVMRRENIDFRCNAVKS
jgi:hypothetical protein